VKRRNKEFKWALYESLRQVEREEAFRLLKWIVDSLPPPGTAAGKASVETLRLQGFDAAMERGMAT